MDYTAKELMVLSAARRIQNKDVVFCGTGISMLAAVAAKHIYAPDCMIFFETGAIDAKLEDLPLAVADSRVMYQAANFCSLTESFALMQNRITGDRIVGIIGAAQIDPYGSLNSTMIGDYKNTKARFPGSGGACDVASFVNTNIIFMVLQKRKFVEKLPYVTSPGWLGGPEGRTEAGIPPNGPSCVITDMGIMEFDSETRRMYLSGVYPGVEPEYIRENVGFDMDVSRAVVVDPPRASELEILRTQTDPQGLILN
ncbi:MAG: ketoacid-CoA transferase [Desulfobacterales bacterium]|nr:ketoacid-CoA transferase [Desulfobacterales bacterium]